MHVCQNDSRQPAGEVLERRVRISRHAFRKHDHGQPATCALEKRAHLVEFLRRLDDLDVVAQHFTVCEAGKIADDIPNDARDARTERLVAPASEVEQARSKVHLALMLGHGDLGDPGAADEG